jgi:hypothetical protein
MFSKNEYVENHLLLGKCRNNATSAAVMCCEDVLAVIFSQDGTEE